MKKNTLNTKGLATVGTVIMLMLSLPFVSSALIRQQTYKQVHENIEDVPGANVALVLGAAAYPTRLSDILEDRMNAAIELLENEKVRKLILTGAPNEVEKMKEYAIENGVGENDLIEDPQGLNTFASLKNADHISELIIVTQAYHLPRALFIARHLGIEAEGYASDRRTYTKMHDFKKREILATSKAMLDIFVFN